MKFWSCMFSCLSVWGKYLWNLEIKILKQEEPYSEGYVAEEMFKYYNDLHGPQNQWDVTYWLARLRVWRDFTWVVSMYPWLGVSYVLLFVCYQTDREPVMERNGSQKFHLFFVYIVSTKFSW